MTLISQQVIELGWRYNPLEHRNAHGEWSRDGSSAMKALSGMKWGGGKEYEHPPADRVAKTGAKASDNAFIRKYGLSAANIVAAYDDATPAERDQGMRWYSDAHTVARMMANGDADKGAALLSTYSPQTDWQTNALNAAHAVELGHSPESGVGISGATKAKANEILSRPDGSTYDDLFNNVGAAKTAGFYRLIRNGGDKPDDTEGDVVIDRHALSVAAGRRLTKDQTETPSYKDVQKEHPDWTPEEVAAYRKTLPEAPVGSSFTYQHIADMYREAAKQVSERDGVQIAPHQMQAITWLRQQRKNNEMDAALVAQAEKIIREGTGKMGAVPGAKEAKGRFSRTGTAWKQWESYAAGHTIATHMGTTAVNKENPISFSLISSQFIELGFDPLQPRDSRGKWTKFGGVGQAVKEIRHNREGFSVSLHDGGQPVHGYMVALDGHTHTYPEQVMDDPKRLARAIDDMLMSERGSFSKPGMFLGGWVSDGKLWLDPSENITDHDAAVKAGRDRNQVAIWDLDNGREIDTGGSGGGRIIEHAEAQAPDQGAGGLLRPARGGTPGEGRGDGGAASLISSQFIELGWHDAWRHELRGPHGEWVRGLEGPHPDFSAEKTRLGVMRQSKYFTQEEKSKLRQAQVALTQGNHFEAASHILDVLNSGAPDVVKTELRSIVDAIAKKAEIPASAPASPHLPDDLRASIAEEINRMAIGADDLGAKAEAAHAHAADRALGIDKDDDRAVRELQLAARAARNAKSYLRSRYYDDIANRIQSARGIEPARPPSDPLQEAAGKFMENADHYVPQMFGDGEKLEWDHQPPSVVGDGELGYGVLAQIGWSGHISMVDSIARQIRNAQQDPDTRIDNPAAIVVPLHELIHATVPEGAVRTGADQEAYRDYRKAQIEEGFTELGTIQHAGEYFEKTGLANRATPILARDDNGDAIVNPEWRADVRGFAAALAAKSADIKSDGRTPWVQAGLHLEDYARTLDEDPDWINTGSFQDFGQYDPLSEVQHLGDSNLASWALAMKKQARDFQETPQDQHETMASLAVRAATPKSIQDGKGWGHYPQETAHAYNFEAMLAVVSTGLPDSDPATQLEIRRLSDQVNAVGTAEKPVVMARQVTAGMNMGGADEGTVLARAAETILEGWDKDEPPVETINKAKNAASAAVRASRTEQQSGALISAQAAAITPLREAA